MNIYDLIIKISSLLTAIGVIIKFIDKNLKKLFANIEIQIQQLQKNQCQNYLVNFLTDIENNNPVSEFQKERAYEMYDIYIKLENNSYIKTKWDKLMKEDV